MSSGSPRRRRWPAAPPCSAGRSQLTCLVGALVPGEAQRDDDVLFAAAAAAGLLGALLLIVHDRLPFWAFHGVALLGTALSTAAAYGWGSESAYGPLPYVWVTLFVFYFFSRPAALLHVALMAAGYALALVEESPSEDPLDGWIATVATLLVTGLPHLHRARPPHAPDRQPQRRRAPRPAHRPAQPPRLPGGLRPRARARPPRRPAAQPDRRRPRPLQARERRPRARRRRRRPQARGGRHPRRQARLRPSGARGRGGVRRARPGRRRARRLHARRAHSRRRPRGVRRPGGRVAHDQLRDLHAPAPRPVGGRPAAHRRPGSLRRQAPRPQSLRDLERRGARHPRPRIARRQRRYARGAGRAR